MTDYSTNGTYLNGASERMSAPRVIAEGDEFAIGRFRLRAEPASSDSPPSDKPAPSEAAAGWAADAPPVREIAPGQQDSRLQRYVAANKIDWLTGMAVIDPSAGKEEVGKRDTPVPGAAADTVWATLLSSAGIAPSDIKMPVTEAAARIGSLLRRLTAGLMLLLTARARAKDELGAAGTIVSLRDNNPLKFLPSADSALASLINPAERGNLDGELAVENAFKDLQAHQMAILIAIQRALRATLTQFAPDSIASRANVGGLMASIAPSMRDAACWRAYQKEFDAIATGSDDAFMESFADTFRKAYQSVTTELRHEKQ